VSGTVHASEVVLCPGAPPNVIAVVLPPVRLEPADVTTSAILATDVQEVPSHVSAVAVSAVGGAGSPVEPPAITARVDDPDRPASILPKLRVSED
jgi:hypothetical protein